MTCATSILCSFSVNVSGNKEVMKIKREEAIQKAQERSEQEAKESAEKKREAEKYALKEQMRVNLN